MLAVIGGSSFAEFAGLQNTENEIVDTPYGPAFIQKGTILQVPIVFLPRHGHPPIKPPHRINYQANIQALAIVGVTDIVAITAVGSVVPEFAVGELVVPDQIIDYTWGRAHTFHHDDLHHVDFTQPFSENMRQRLIKVLAFQKDNQFHRAGVYGCSQGPRLETAAEIKRMYKDGCTIVGMTAMPEAALAREKNLDYSLLSVIVNKGAGIDAVGLDLQAISDNMKVSMARVRAVLTDLISRP